MANLRLSHAFGFLVPEPGPRRVFGLSTLVSTFGFLLVGALAVHTFGNYGLRPAAAARWGERTRPLPVSDGEARHAVAVE